MAHIVPIYLHVRLGFHRSIRRDAGEESRPSSALFLNHNLRERGTYFRNFHLARVLAERGWNTTILTVSPRRTLRPSVDMVRGVRVIQTPQFLTPHRFAASGFCPIDSLYRCLRMGIERFDVVFVSDHLPNVSAPFFAAKLMHPRSVFVADWADLFTDGGVHEHWNTLLAQPVYRASRFLERGLKGWADLCTATSRPLLRILQDQIGVDSWRTLHLPSGCDLKTAFPASMLAARNQLGLPADALIVGRTCSSDRITPTEMQAMLALADRYRALTGREALIYLIGPCDPKKYPKLFAGNCQVRFTGKLKPEQVPVHLAACDLFLLIEDDEVNCRFRGPIRLNDYLAAGRPVVCNSIGDHVVTLTAHEACVVADDFAAPNAVLDVVLTNAVDRDAMGRRARALAEGRLCWDNLGRKLESLILQYIAVLHHETAPIPAHHTVLGAAR